MFLVGSLFCEDAVGLETQPSNQGFGGLLGTRGWGSRGSVAELFLPGLIAHTLVGGPGDRSRGVCSISVVGLTSMVCWCRINK